MDKTIIGVILIILAFLILVGFLYLFLFPEEPTQKCGNGICEPLELSSCPEDCTQPEPPGDDGTPPKDNETTDNQSLQPILYITFYNHNEEDTDREGRKESEPDYNGDETVLLHYTNAMRELGKVMQKHGAKLELGSDWTFLEGVKKYDPEFAEDFTAMGQIIETHSHEGYYYDYLDVKNKIRELGVEPPPIVNGMLEAYWNNPKEYWNRSYYEYFDSVYPEFTILFGAGTLYHREPEEATSWVWRPSKENLFGHDPDGKFIYVGKGKGVVSSILNNGFESIELYSDRINTASYPVPSLREFKACPDDSYYDDFPEEWKGTAAKCWKTMIEGIDKNLEKLDELKAEGKIVYASVEEVAGIFEQKEGQLNFDWNYTTETVPRDEGSSFGGGKLNNN